MKSGGLQRLSLLKSWWPLHTMHLTIHWLILLNRWHPITVPCWNSLSSSEWPILSQMLVETAWLGASFYTPVAMEVAPEFDLDGWVNSFGNIVFFIYLNCCAYLDIKIQFFFNYHNNNVNLTIWQWHCLQALRANALRLISKYLQSFSAVRIAASMYRQCQTFLTKTWTTQK